jgi:RNA polymerase sigma-70 factor (ECF subfamily)
VPDALSTERTTSWLTLDEDSFRVFYAETAPALLRYARRVSGNRATADDVLQESYLRLLQSRVEVRSASELRAYLFRIATNLLNDHFREASRNTRRASDETHGVEPAFDRASEVSRGLHRLRPRERQLLWLAYAEGSTHHEIAAAMGLRSSSIRTLLFRARRKLMALLDGS